MVAVLTVADIKPETKMTDIFDRLISQLTESDFKFSRQYTVKSFYSKASGKWADITPDALFLDSRKFFSVYENLIHERLIEIVKR